MKLKKTILSGAFIMAATQLAFSQVGPEITSWVRNTSGSTGYGGISSNIQTVQYSATQVYVSATCIPGYNIGPWASNPNLPSNQNLVHKFTRTPVQNTATAVYTELGSIGLWSNGVVIYNPKDGQYWNNATSAFTGGATTTGWNRNAKYYEGISFDACLGHPAQNGAYHHHVSPTCLYSQTLTTTHSPIIGYAFDGFPIYGAYGYTNVNGTGAIKRMTPSFVLASSTGSILTGANAATAAASSTVATTRQSGPPVNSTYPLGSMCEDYIYVAGSGDLDKHNGRFCVTPEYPAGTYAYFVTIDAGLNPVYPFVIGPTYYGTVQTGNTGPTGGHVTISESTTVYSGTTGLADLDSKLIDIQIAPNPTSDYVYITVNPESKNNISCKVYSNKGDLIQQMDYLQPSITYTLDVTNYPSGIYMIVLESDKQTVKKKIIKHR
jgi:hypothetical protein